MEMERIQKLNKDIQKRLEEEIQKQKQDIRVLNEKIELERTKKECQKLNVLQPREARERDKGTETMTKEEERERQERELWYIYIQLQDQRTQLLEQERNQEELEQKIKQLEERNRHSEDRQSLSDRETGEYEMYVCLATCCSESFLFANVLLCLLLTKTSWSHY